MAVSFEAFDLSGSVSLDINDADKILIRLNRTAKTTDEQLSQLQKQAVNTANAFKRLGDAANQKTAANAAKQFQATRDNLKNLAPDQAITQINKAKNKVNELNNELLKLKTTQAGVAKEFSSGFSNRLGIGGVTAGSFAGGLAAGAVLEAGAAVKSLALGVADLGVSSVRMAAEMSQTERTIQVFAGSLGNARKELAELDKLAAVTPGLTLRDAEVGYARLRALNFEAKLAQDLLIGISKQRILSNADQDAVNRVIVNITQLASGSPRLTQDIKEMILAMPTLRQNIIETFGSLEKFKSELRIDPTGALEKFGVGMKNTETRSVGLFDALEKMNDSFTRMGREAGKPILQPLTETVLSLTGYLNDNRSAWANWGQYIADVVTGVKVQLDGVNNPPRSSTGNT